MTAGDTNTLITVTSGGFILTGGTVTLIIKKTNSTVAAVSYGMTVVSGGLSATYTTTGTEFPTGGLYEVQMKYVNGSSQFSSSIMTIIVTNQLV